MQTLTDLPVIQRTEQISPSGDYGFLYEQGLSGITKYSSDLWNNYNTGDPGITILQSLCYTLTELGYKTDFAMRDILTRKDGSINYDNRFIKPQNILPSSPVSLLDFKKVLLDEVSELKHVYFNINSAKTINTLIPYLELRPQHIDDLNIPDFQNNIISKVSRCLLSYQNVGTLFGPPILLDSRLMVLGGSIYLSETVDVEQFIAELIYQLNNFISPYPIFYSYEQLVDLEYSNDEIFDGPLLNGGFLLDDNFKRNGEESFSKRKNISLDSVMSLITDMTGVMSVTNLSVKPKSSTPDESSGFHINSIILPLEFNTSPYFDIMSIKHQCQEFNPPLEGFMNATSQLNIVQYGRNVSLDTISESMVQYHLLKMIPKANPKTNYDKYLPKGNYKNIKDYYSLQFDFPEVYNLNKNNNNEGAKGVAKTKQLKAYLILFEQLLANYLAQLSHLGDLFSFDSGRSIYQLAGPTYFFQDLYNVPGIQDLLKDVRGFARRTQDLNNNKDWSAYQRDVLNPYRQELMAALETPSANLDRKGRVLNHLLARYGERYQPRYLHYNNPNYGDNRTAEIVQVSDTLNNFPVYSANRARSYFYINDSREEIYSGFELIAGEQLCLTDYYQGLYDICNSDFSLDAEGTTIYYTKDGHTYTLSGGEYSIKLPGSLMAKNNWLEVYKDEKMCRAFVFQDDILDHLFGTQNITDNRVAINDLLGSLFESDQYLLSQLINRTKGFVFIDNIRLFEGFIFCLEIIDSTTGASKGTICIYDMMVLQETLAYLRSDQRNGFVEFLEFNINESNIWHDNPHEDEMPDSNLAINILDQFDPNNFIDLELNIYKKTENTNDGSLNMLGMEIPMHFVDSTVTALFPNWISLLQEDQYQGYLREKLDSILPMNTQLDVRYISLQIMGDLLELFEVWVNGLYEQEDVHYEAWEILRILKNAI